MIEIHVRLRTGILDGITTAQSVWLWDEIDRYRRV